MPPKLTDVRLTLRTTDIDLPGNRAHHVGVVVHAECSDEPQPHMMEIAVVDIMKLLSEEMETGSTAPRESGIHDVDILIIQTEPTQHIELQSNNCYTKVEPIDFQDKLLHGLQKAEWFKILKTGECKCDFTLEFDE